MPTFASTTGVAAVSNETYTADGSVCPDSVITCEVVNGWLKMMSK